MNQKITKQKISSFKLQELLKDKNSEELKALIIDFSFSKEVQSYFYLRLHPQNVQRVSEEYKKIIKEEFFPKKGSPLLRYDMIKKYIKDFEVASPLKNEVAKLMLYFIEIGSEFSCMFGEIDYEFYEMIEDFCENTFIYIRENNLVKEFESDCKKLIKNSCDEWGFRGQLEDMYDEIIVKQSNVFMGVSL